VSRLGGDEFVLLLTQIDSAGDCEQIASRILTRIAQPATIAGNRLQVSGSIGITLYPVDDADADTLLRHADQAMYLAKADGRNRFRLHAPPSGRSSD
jgi:diguanylate cyclase (GGDEF)-like protein